MNENYEFRPGTFLWVQLKDKRYVEPALYSEWNGCLGYYLTGDATCYQRSAFSRIWETPIQDPRIRRAKSLMRTNYLEDLSQQDAEDIQNLTCGGCIVEGCFSKRHVDGCFRSRFLGGQKPKKRK